MVKLSPHNKTHLAARANEIRRIRGRYNQAIELGYTPGEAAALAAGNDPLVEPGAAVVPVEEVAAVPTSTAHVTLRPIATQVSASALDNVPPNWEDLPWPNLRKLAMDLSGKNIVSRRDAVEAISAAMKVAT